MTIDLHGYRYSVYARIARMALHEKGVAYAWHEVDPFAEHVPAAYLEMNPFRRVPTLVHDGFALYETAAITRYVDEAFEGPRLQPDDPVGRARMAQIVAIIDSYGYWPMVRQVYAQRVFGPMEGEAADEAEITDGLRASRQVLAALESLCGDSGFLVGSALTLADIHLAPMMAYFAAAPEGADMLAGCPRLAAWWGGMADRGSLIETDPHRAAPSGFDAEGGDRPEEED